MATSKQIEQRIQQTQENLKSLSATKLSLGKALASLKKGSPEALDLDCQLKKNEADTLNAQEALDRLEAELSQTQGPSKSEEPPSANALNSSDAMERLRQMEAQIEDMSRLEKQLELAQRSNLDRFKQVQLQIRDLAKLTDRLLLVESQLRELKLKIHVFHADLDDQQDDLFKDASTEEKAVFQPQSANTSPVGEPLGPAPDSPWPWPEAMSRFLKGWLQGRKWWGHEDWTSLLRQIGTQDFAKFADREHHAQIGIFLETHRS